MRLRSIHPGVTIGQIEAATPFELALVEDLSESRSPTAEELHIIRDVIDPGDRRGHEFA